MHLAVDTFLHWQASPEPRLTWIRIFRLKVQYIYELLLMFTCADAISRHRQQKLVSLCTRVQVHEVWSVGALSVSVSWCSLFVHSTSTAAQLVSFTPSELPCHEILPQPCRAGWKTGKKILWKLYSQLRHAVDLYGACRHMVDGRGHVNEPGWSRVYF